MRLKALVMAGVIVVATSSIALAQTDCTKIVPPVPRGLTSTATAAPSSTSMFIRLAVKTVC